MTLTLPDGIRTGWTWSLQLWIMGCSASVVLLLRSVGGADCGHMCSRQDQLSLDAATPTLEGYTTTTPSLTIVVMVTSTSAPQVSMHARVGSLWELQHVPVV